jgi:hypothetical protein
MKTRSLRMMKGTAPAPAGRVGFSRDMVRDWHRWSRAERAAAICIVAALLTEMSFGLAAGIRSVT